MRNAFILAVDVGAGSLRGGLVRANGRVAATAVVPLTTSEPRPGWAEVDPECWWDALLAAIARLLRNVPRSARILGICICGLTRTQVLLDDRKRVVGPAILFRDRRAAALVPELGIPGLTAFDASARLAWIARHQPARFARIDCVVEPKDFLNFRLTGVLAGDTVTHSRQPATGPIVRGNLVSPWHAVGVVTSTVKALARIAGVPVFAGSMDTWASAVGSGAVSAGHAYDVAGTSEVVGLVCARRCAAPGLLSLQWTDDAYQIGGPTQAGADCAQWGHAAFGVRGRLGHAIERVGSVTQRTEPPLFLPYLAGERAPVWRSDVRGAFHLVGRHSTSDDFFWAVLEGVAMAVRDILELAKTASGVRVTQLFVCGGGARSDAWCRLKADVTGLQVVRSRETETGVIGAAIAAAVGSGLHPSVREAAAHMVALGRRFEPRARFASRSDTRFAQYRQIKQAALALRES
ncbi:MAG: FGGY-family carbohydrate kinase [Casimicrobiaceae bacterium]